MSKLLIVLLVALVSTPAWAQDGSASDAGPPPDADDDIGADTASEDGESKGDDDEADGEDGDEDGEDGEDGHDGEEDGEGEDRDDAESAAAEDAAPPTAPAESKKPPTTAAEDADLEAQLDEMSIYDEAADEPTSDDEEQSNTVDTFGSSLATLGIKTTISGYGDILFIIPLEDDGVITFDQYHINPIISAFIGEKFFTEFELEYEHGGDEILLEYAILDVLLAEQFVIRAGKFLVPLGQFNEYYHPSFRNQMISRPFAMREVVPSTFADVGIELFGSLRASSLLRFQYAAFVSNGLEQQDDDPEDEIIPSGGGIRDMRGNTRDKNDSDKALGGRLGVKLLSEDFDLTAGLSAYTGAYTIDGNRRLSIFVGDLALRYKGLTARTEGVYAYQEAEGGALDKHGLYSQIAYKFGFGLEGVLRYDYITLASDTRQRIAAALGFYFLESIALRNEFGGVHSTETDDITYEDTIQLSFAF